MTSPRFLGVSTGRAGSRWINAVFNTAGIPSLHEHVYRANHFRNGKPRRWKHAELGEWSAQAVPFLPEYDGIVFHQVRHPLAVVASYLDFGLFNRPERFGQEGSFLRHEATITGQDPLGEAVRFYVEWNLRCERYADMRWRLDEVDAELLVTVGDMLGHPVDYGAAVVAVEGTVNAFKGRRKTSLTWDDMPDTEWTVRMVEMADRYGFDTP